MRTAKAAVMTGVEKDFEIREYPIVPPPDGMAGMSLIASGVCGTDVHIHRGKIPVGTPCVIGHEFVGRVEDISAADAKQYSINPGDNVIVDIACPCGKCELCLAGDDANCVNLGVTNGGNPDIPPHFYGGYAEYNVSPVKNLVRIPDGLDPKTVCVFACAGPTCLHAFSLARRANCALDKVETAVVQGLGPVGSFAMAYLAAMGVPRIIAVGTHCTDVRLSTAKRMGATEIINLSETPAEKAIEYIRSVSGIGADLVFEASGTPSAVPQGMAMLRNRGIYLIPGQYSNSGTVAISPQLITFNALQIFGSSQYSLCDVADYLELLKKNPRLCETVASLASEYKVEDVNRAIADAKTGKNVKTILVP